MHCSPGIVLFAALFAMPGTGQAADGKSPVQVFLLAGQSNMQGIGRIAADPNRNGGNRSPEYLVADARTQKHFEHTVDTDGK
ncbi:MAG: hypothetical protein VB858_19430 [Planctomycetaceae bacterium]